MQSKVQKVEVPVVANVAAAVEKCKEEKGKEKVVVEEV